MMLERVPPLDGKRIVRASESLKLLDTITYSHLLEEILYVIVDESRLLSESLTHSHFYSH